MIAYKDIRVGDTISIAGRSPGSWLPKDTEKSYGIWHYRVLDIEDDQPLIDRGDITVNKQPLSKDQFNTYVRSVQR